MAKGCCYLTPRAGVWSAKFGPGNSVAHRKPNLPQKLCAACNRPFAWRKKWERVWDEVRYCSDACRDGRRAASIQKRKG
jgi:hypothetical protein